MDPSLQERALNNSFFCEYAWLGGDDVTANVLITVENDRITAVTPDAQCPPAARRLTGLTMPGFANAHSHVFHRAIRGRGQQGVDSFWAWRNLMYSVAGTLTPDSLYELALATYAEMSLAGVTSVGEFFYVHHDPAGRRYSNPNIMGETVIQAAEDAGLRITLLDTCYLQGGVDGRQLTGVQQRFTDGSWENWAKRVGELKETATARAGAAIHSVRAVPRHALGPVAAFARAHNMPVHAHVSEQPAENQDCLDVYGLTPTQLLAEAGVLGADMTSVHATHLTEKDVASYGATGTSICMCATTERDLADGVGPAGQLLEAGARLCVGSDAHMMIDLLEEGRAIELDLRLTSGSRGHVNAAQIADAITAGGAHSLGWDAGSIAAGKLADFTVIDLLSPRTAGAASGEMLPHIIFAAAAADVRTVIRGGKIVVDQGTNIRVPDTGAELNKAISKVIGAL
ncbi:formimidoylglutamate deiminase [Paeniglutamicibacter antarcticus]|uniref:Formimidoylglutamate deiminase n=1 Tax=Arthrobacter terrae TaxID=2935737 RepID=A0A931CJ46_9MICC|nr:formimidoylglutamate deiminase [Arthrobacter terrae]